MKYQGQIYGKINGKYVPIEVQLDDIIEAIQDLPCKGCTHLYNNDRHCTLSHNHCIRKAEDYYEELKEVNHE